MTTPLDLDTARQFLAEAVPFNKHLGIEYVELTRDRAVLRLPDDPRLHNHVQGPHAAALFGLAEAASGGVVLANFVDQLSSVVPLAAHAEVDYLAVARGTVTATATLGTPRDELLALLAAGERVRFPVQVTVEDSSGEVVSQVRVDWHLKRTKPPAAT